MNTIRGTQDILNLTLFNYVIQKARQHMNLHNFNEISTPILEPIELFKRSLGLHTDVVTKEMFTVTASGSEQICLRPEATASTMRAFLSNAGNLVTPWKVFSIGPMFRHERPQKGRFRQFNQISIEIIDAPSISNDGLGITLLERFFQNTLKLDTYALLINFLGCANDRLTFKKTLYSFLEGIKHLLCEQCNERKDKNIMRVFDCKQSTCQEQYRTAPRIAENLCEHCAREWQELKNMLEILSVSYTYAPSLVRGLDYYDKTVFEFVSGTLGAQNTFCGGGRYNHLAEVIDPTSKTYPSFGASIGVERVVLMLEENNNLSLPQKAALHVLIPLTEQQHPLALVLADELSTHQITTDILLEPSSLKSMMRKAHKMGARSVILIGENEQQSGIVVIKNMITGTEETIPQNHVVSYLKK